MALLTLILGIVTGVLFIKALPVIKKMPWYHLVLAAAAYGVFLFGAFFVQISFYEGEPRAGYMGVALFGSIALVLACATYFFGYKPTKAKLSEGVK